MKRYIITSPKFTGEINVIYGLDSKLMSIDFTKCDLTEEQIKYFKFQLPALFDVSDPNADLSAFFGKSNLNIVPEGFKVTFEEWWTAYNFKRNKIRTEKEWNKLKEPDHVKAYFNLAIYERYLSLNTWRTKNDPDTYLRNRLFENEWK